MVNLTYKRAKDGVTCVTKCPYGEDRFVGSLGCEACRYHFMKLAGSRQVICSFVDRKS